MWCRLPMCTLCGPSWRVYRMRLTSMAGCGSTTNGPPTRSRSQIWRLRSSNKLPLQTLSVQQKIAYHWQNFKIDESGLPYGQLSVDAWLYGTTPRDSTNALWVCIQAASAEKREFNVRRKIGVFLKGVHDAKKVRKKLNLKVHAANFRDSYSAEVAWEIACLFCHFAPDFQRALTPNQWAEALKRFW